MGGKVHSLAFSFDNCSRNSVNMETWLLLLFWCLVLWKCFILFGLAFICSGYCFQDSGAFLCVIDESNEHMLSVWDCKGTKHAEVKVKNSELNRLWKSQPFTMIRLLIITGIIQSRNPVNIPHNPQPPAYSFSGVDGGIKVIAC